MPSLYGQTIAEKKQGLHKGGMDMDKESQRVLQSVNQSLALKKSVLKSLYAQAVELYNEEACPEQYQQLLQHINCIRAEMAMEEREWRDRASQHSQADNYALWHQPETNVEQLVIDFGSQEYVYLMTPEIAGIRLSVNSNIPIPRESWSELLELVLSQNGIGIRQVNPFLRELYVINNGPCGLKYITNNRMDLEFFPPETRVGFMLSPNPAEIRRILMFLDKFINPNTTLLHLIGRDILLVASAAEIVDLLKLYDFVVANRHDQQYKLIPLRRLPAEQMAQMLYALFDQAPISRACGPRVPPPPKPATPPCTPGGPAVIPAPIEFDCNEEAGGLKIIVMSGLCQALFLVGTPDEICRAEQMICEVECQIGNAREKVVYWYITRYSDPEELADILFRIYNMMIQERVIVVPGGPGGPVVDSGNVTTIVEEKPTALYKYPEQLYQENWFQEGDVAVNPAPVTLVPNRVARPPNEGRPNFIVDLKTGAIVMVVEEDLLEKLLEVARKLDVPKKMVQIEVLLFEKRLRECTDYGLNLLRIGAAASNTHATSLTYNDHKDGPCHGILHFMISRMANHGLPAYDFAYNFLLSQEDVQINSNPSVLTMNQTPARVAIVEEFSINTGTFEVETVKGVTLKDAYTRGQYGITLDIIPTIHMRDSCEDFDDDSPNMITLETNVNFDTIQSDIANRPTVVRRNITNEVIIPDGQTVILGGLRRKNSHDKRDGIPFLCEIPAIGKLFSTVGMKDDKTDMYIFITPKIVVDPAEDLYRIRAEEMARRPGDIPDFLCRLVEAREYERTRIFAQSMKILLGREPGRCIAPLDGVPTMDCPAETCEYMGEYDGR